MCNVYIERRLRRATALSIAARDRRDRRSRELSRELGTLPPSNGRWSIYAPCEGGVRKPTLRREVPHENEEPAKSGGEERNHLSAKPDRVILHIFHVYPRCVIRLCEVTGAPRREASPGSSLDRRHEGSERKRSGATTGPGNAGPPTSLRRRVSRAAA